MPRTLPSKIRTIARDVTAKVVGSGGLFGVWRSGLELQIDSLGWVASGVMLCSVGWSYSPGSKCPNAQAALYSGEWSDRITEVASVFSESTNTHSLNFIVQRGP
jgi:hypothetical protein